MFEIIMNDGWKEWEIGRCKTKAEAVILIQYAVAKDLIDSNESNGNYEIRQV